MARTTIRVFSILIVFAFLTVFITGCGKSGKQTSTTQSPTETKAATTKTETKGAEAEATASGDPGDSEFVLPIVTEPLTLTFWTEMKASAVKVIKDLNDCLAYEEMERRTGIHIDFISPPAGQEAEHYKLMVAAGDWPDLIEHQSKYGIYPGGFEKGVLDGVFLKLNDLIDQHAPNFKKARMMDAEIEKLTITDSGMICAFPMIQTTDELPWNGPIIRKDWLDDLGLKEPATISDWYAVLKEFKDKKGATAPLIFPAKGYDTHFAFVGTYGIAADFYNENNVVKYGSIEPGFKDYLAEMNRWYSDGLIDQDFMTRDKQGIDALVLTDKAGAWIGSYGAYLDNYVVAKRDDPKFKISGVAYPTLNPGDKLHLRNFNLRVKGYDTVITTACKHPVEAVKWMDYRYTDEGYMLFNWGIENVSYVMEDGKPKFTDLLINNPDGFSYDVILYKYKLHTGSFLRDWRAYRPFSDEQEHAMKVWSEAGADYVMPPVSMTAEESTRFAEIMNEVKTYVDQMTLKFITGQEPLSNFDSFVSQVKKMNIDEAIAIQQAALDRYISR
jgi:putative aldouronate transport system substrate-binding protein